MRKLLVTPEMVLAARQIMKQVKAGPARNSRAHRDLIKLARVQLATERS